MFHQNSFASQGWECPKCKRVYSPFTHMCLHCVPSSSKLSGIYYPQTGTNIGNVGNTTLTTTESNEDNN